MYTDLIHTLEKLPNEQAGKLFKIILEYVNDKNPDISNEDLLIQVVFEPIKQQLKRDLKKWETYVEKQSVNGKKGGRPKTEALIEESQKTQAFFEKPKKAVSVNVSVTDNVNDNVTVKEKSYKNTLLSQIVKADLDESLHIYFDIALAFYQLFEKILTEAGGTLTTLRKAKGTWIDDIRLLVESDKASIDDVRLIWSWLPNNDFWKKNILSASTLRKQYNKLLIEAKNYGKLVRNPKEGTTWDELAEITARHFNLER